LHTGPLTEDGTDFEAVDPFIVCPQGMFTKAKAKNMNSTNANLFNILKNGLWKWTEELEDENSKDFNPNIRETEDCLVRKIK
jgi:hypothetical protein